MEEGVGTCYFQGSMFSRGAGCLPLLFLLFPLLSCGSASEESLYSHGEPSTSAGGAATTGGAPGRGGSSTQNGGSFASGGSGGGDGGRVAATGGAISGGETGTGAISSSGGDPGAGGAPASGGASPDSGPPPSLATPGTISCGGTPCTIAGAVNNVCCLGFPVLCLPDFPTGCGRTGNMPVYCDDASDCGNSTVCCITVTSSATSAKCDPDCETSTGTTEQLCRTDAECGHNRRCVVWQKMPDYNICQ
jgi:hypothetical protein